MKIKTYSHNKEKKICGDCIDTLLSLLRERVPWVLWELLGEHESKAQEYAEKRTKIYEYINDKILEMARENMKSNTVE